MTRATLIIHQPSGEDITAEFDVQTDEQKAVIEILPNTVQIHTPTEPKVADVNAWQPPDWRNDPDVHPGHTSH